MSYEKLKATLSQWDTDLWGYKVGHLYVPQGTIPTAYVIDANQDNFDVVFVKAKGWHEEKKGRVAVDWRFDMELLHPPQKILGEPAVVSLEGPLAAHMEIARTAFIDSRFLRDPMIAEKVPELYRRWLMAAEGQLWALDGQQKEDGFLVQTYDEDKTPRISLIGVAEKYRGLGLGERLALGVMNRFESAKAWRVTVAVRNWRAIRFYEGMGFRVKEVTTAFHIWI